MTMYVIITSKGGVVMTKAISIRIDTELLEYLRSRADREHRTLSNMICDILMSDKIENGRPNVKVGDVIKYADRQAKITNIDNGTWSITWDDGELDLVPTLLQHNWKKA